MKTYKRLLAEKLIVSIYMREIRQKVSDGLDR